MGIGEVGESAALPAALACVSNAVFHVRLVLRVAHAGRIQQRRTGLAVLQENTVAEGRPFRPFVDLVAQKCHAVFELGWPRPASGLADPRKCVSLPRDAGQTSRVISSTGQQGVHEPQAPP